MSTASVPKKRPQAGKRATSFEPEVAKAFGAVIRTERERLQMAQDQFALVAHVDRSYYGKLERGERQPSLGLLLRVAAGLGVPAADLVRAVESRLQSESSEHGSGKQTPRR